MIPALSADRLQEAVAEHDPGEVRASAIDSELQQLIKSISGHGFVFEPWQIAAFVAALRTKPFIILAGTSGTAKTSLPRLVAAATGAHIDIISVRPDWADSSELIGYHDLHGQFQPGSLLRIAARAKAAPERLHICVLDEMNLARVEHYLAEVLSLMERRSVDPEPTRSPLVSQALSAADASWGEIDLPANLALIGTVNMDETTRGFSRKVLDRAFVLELSHVDLRRWQSTSGHPASEPVADAWSMTAWRSSAPSLTERVTSPAHRADRAQLDQIVEQLIAINGILSAVQLQIGFRTRNEIAQFVLNANEIRSSFVAHDGQAVDATDLVLMMKILPRIAGSSAQLRRALAALVKLVGAPHFESSVQDLEYRIESQIDSWQHQGRPVAIAGARYPRTAGRLYMMWERLIADGFASFWM